MQIAFLLNGQTIRLTLDDPHVTTLNWLRDNGHVGSKEGCAEGDCGACTAVMAEVVDGQIQLSPVNTCIQLLSRLNGCALITVEGLSQDSIHPIQQAVVDEHGSQCGYCTPGFVMALYYGLNARPPQNREQACDLLAGNLCRCTGYQGLLRVAMDLPKIARDRLEPLVEALAALHAPAPEEHPTTLNQALALRAQWPDAQVVAGNTDVGLWVTKRHQRFERVLMLHRIPELQQIHLDNGQLVIGAMVTYTQALATLTQHWPSVDRYLKRIGSVQVRSAGTLGGNLANGSPIGDMPPMLIALQAQIELQSARGTRHLPLEQFFIQYGVQDLADDELLVRIHVPMESRSLAVAKLSKRADQDISAVSLGLSARVENGCLLDPVIAFGGMAGTPKRARHLEQALNNCPLDRVDWQVLAQDFEPLSDARASAEYRMRAAQGMVKRACQQLLGQPIEVLV